MMNISFNKNSWKTNLTHKVFNGASILSLQGLTHDYNHLISKHISLTLNIKIVKEC